jgi:hypothetical protein
VRPTIKDYYPRKADDKRALWSLDYRILEGLNSAFAQPRVSYKSKKPGYSSVPSSEPSDIRLNDARLTDHWDCPGLAASGPVRESK